MTETTDAEQELRDAEAEAAEAQALVDELERRLVEGDQDAPTPEQLDEQHRLSKWAKLRAQGAAKRHARAQAAAAVEAAKQAIDQVAGIETRDAELAKAWTAAFDALRNLQAAAAARSQLVRDNATLLRSHDAKLQRVAGTNLAALGALPARYHNDTGYQIPDRGLDVADLPASDLIAAAIGLAVDPHSADAAGRAIYARRIDFPDGTLCGKVTGLRDAVRAAIGQDNAK